MMLMLYHIYAPILSFIPYSSNFNFISLTNYDKFLERGVLTYRWTGWVVAPCLKITCNGKWSDGNDRDYMQRKRA
jgi:hypothetical protein